MRWLKSWGGKADSAAVSDEFRRVLTREILKTELVRIKALIVTTSVLTLALWSFYIFAPEQLNELWHGKFKPAYLYVTLVPFILFELFIHAMVKRQLKLDRDLPVFRRYLSAFIETSTPTVVLALHIDNMGSVQALGYVVPLS
jgi:adenylate cyclase